MPDVPYIVATASSTQPVFSRPPWTVAVGMADGRGLGIGPVGDVRQVSLAKMAIVLGLAVLCWMAKGLCAFASKMVNNG